MERRSGRVAVLLAAGAMLLVAAPMAAANHAGPLAGQWHLDGSTADGEHTPDSSGHGLDAFTDPTPRYLPGKFGNAYSGAPSDGEAYSQIGVSKTPLLEPQTVTLMAWVRRNGSPGSYHYVAGKGASACDFSSYALYTGASGGLQFYVRGADSLEGDPIPLSEDAGFGVWDGQWHQVAGTYDGSSMRLYVDGSPIGQPKPAPPAIDYSPANGEFDIGTYPNTGCGPTWVASIDEVRVYDRALTDAEIQRLNTNGPSPPDLVPEVPGGGGAGGALPPPVTPRFFSAKAVKLKHAAWMSALASQVPAGVQIKRYDWDLNGDGRYEAGCGPQAPALSTTFRLSGKHAVGLKITDSFNRTTVTKQDVLITKAQANTTRQLFFDCEKPLGTNQPDRKDCVKTFAFGIVDVNARGPADQCFKITERVNPALLEVQGRSSGVLQQIKNSYVQSATVAGPVSLNGIPIPIPANRVTSFDAWESKISIGDDVPIYLPLPGGKLTKVLDVPLNVKVTPTGKEKRFKLPPLKAPKIAKFGALSLGGGLEISLLPRASEFKISLKLPDIFKLGFNREAEGTVTLRANNIDGLQFEGARIAHIPQVFMGPLLVNDLFFEYKRTGDAWSGGANFQLAGISPVQIKAAPPPPDYGFGMRGGKFDHAGGGIAFPNPPRPELFPGVSLQEIGGSIGVKPYRFTGRLTIAAAEIAAIDGSAFIALANRDSQYDFPEEFAPPGLEFLAGRHLDSPSIAVGGQSKLQVPILGQIPLINSYLFYAFPDYVEFGGGFKFEKTLADQKFSVDGGIGGFASIGRRIFNLEGHVTGCLDVDIIGNICKGVDAVISSKGIGFCTVVPIPVSPFGPVIPVDAGLGYKWGAGTPDIMIFSCDAGPYREARPASARAAQSGTRSFTLPGGLPSAMVRVTGEGGPPSVVLTGPGGKRVLAPQTDASAVDQNVAVLRLAQESTTLIALRQPAGGRWTITAQPGSAIKSVSTRVGLAAPSIRARVSGHGARRILHYAVRQDPGQTVTFAERGRRTFRPIGAATAARGSVRFTPAAGSAGKRTIVALVQRDGVTKRTLDVASYTAPGTARPAKPRRLRAARRRGALVVSWARARGAFQYSVTVQLGNGRRLLRVTKRRRVVIGGIDPRTRASVRVAGLTADGVHGSEAARALRARRR